MAGDKSPTEGPSARMQTPMQIRGQQPSEHTLLHFYAHVEAFE